MINRLWSLLCRCFGHLTRGHEMAGARREQSPPARRRDRFRHELVPELTIGMATTRSRGSASSSPEAGCALTCAGSTIAYAESLGTTRPATDLAVLEA